MKAAFPLLAMVLVLSLTGCGSSDTAPPPAAMAPRSTAPPKVPTTTEEKIQAIQNSGIPEAQKKEAIDKVKSGQL